MLVKLCRTTDMECSHGQLRSRLADRLSSNDADRFTNIDNVAMGQIAAITHGTNTMLGATRQNGTNINPFNAGAVDFLRQRLINRFIGFYNHFVGKRIFYFLQCHATQHTLAGGFNHFAAFHQRRYVEPVNGFTILLRNDTVLSNIHQPSCQITGIGCFQSRVR